MEDEKKCYVINYWRENVEPCKNMTSAEILDCILAYAISREFDEINSFKKWLSE